MEILISPLPRTRNVGHSHILQVGRWQSVLSNSVCIYRGPSLCLPCLWPWEIQEKYVTESLPLGVHSVT